MPAVKFKQFGQNWLATSSFVVTFLLLLPIAVIVGFVFNGSADVFSHLYNTVLADYVSNSLLLMLGVGFGVLLLGIPTAWLTKRLRIPGAQVVFLGFATAFSCPCLYHCIHLYRLVGLCRTSSNPSQRYHWTWLRRVLVF